MIWRLKREERVNVGKYVFVVFTQPVDSRDAEYNEWYDSVHVADVERLDGVVSARRYRLAEMEPPQAGHPPYLALYELDVDDVSDVPRAIQRAIAEGRMPISDALDRSANVTAYYEAL
jgi:hypothetical protein